MCSYCCSTQNKVQIRLAALKIQVCALLPFDVARRLPGLVFSAPRSFCNSIRPLLHAGQPFQRQAVEVHGQWVL
jgi:hypothetical protein